MMKRSDDGIKHRVLRSCLAQDQEHFAGWNYWRVNMSNGNFGDVSFNLVLIKIKRLEEPSRIF